MPNNPAPLLPAALIEQIKGISKAIRNGEVAPLVGAGVSVGRGLPGWNALVDRLILAWRSWDPSKAARRLSPDNYIRLIRQDFKSDLAAVSYLRHRIKQTEGLSFGQLLYSALYSSPTANLITPEPSDVHRHLVSLFRRHPSRLWTLNYDDLLEEAARSMKLSVHSLDPERRYESKGLAVAHLHGFLPPPKRAAGYPGPNDVEAILTLSEDDFHLIATDIIGWTNREFYRLFDEYRVLMLGMSLDDPNVRRILASNRYRSADSEPRHFILMRGVSSNEVSLPRVRANTQSVCAQDANSFRAWYWRQHGVEVVELPDHNTILPFLVRLRYESFGTDPGELWKNGHEKGWAKIHPWGPEQQRVGKLLLDSAFTSLQKEFSVSAGELVEIGVFLLRDDATTLELTFRGGSTREAKSGEAQFSADPDNPTGVAGRVFVSGDGVRVAESDPLHDYGLRPGERKSTSVYQGIISVPIVDWEQRGVPVGVIYVTVATTSGTLFKLPPRSFSDKPDSLEDLYLWLHRLAMELVKILRKMGPKN